MKIIFCILALVFAISSAEKPTDKITTIPTSWFFRHYHNITSYSSVNGFSTLDWEVDQNLTGFVDSWESGVESKTQVAVVHFIGGPKGSTSRGTGSVFAVVNDKNNLKLLQDPDLVIKVTPPKKELEGKGVVTLTLKAGGKEKTLLLVLAGGEQVPVLAE